MNRRRLLAAVALIVGSAGVSCTNSYLGRYLVWNAADVRDYEHYPSRAIRSAGPGFEFRESAEARERFARLCPSVSYRLQGKTVTMDLEQFLVETGTHAFLVVQDDVLLFEGYFNGHARDSICPSFSVAKSLASALIGIAVAEGFIDSVEDPITRYLPELVDGRLDRVTIRHLLSTCSGFRSSLSVFPWSEEPRAYFSPNIRRLVLRPKTPSPGSRPTTTRPSSSRSPTACEGPRAER